MMKNDYKNWLDQFPLPNSTSNKYSRGSVLIIGGEKNCTGAARLAALAAAKIAGMVTIACPNDALIIYATSMMSVMTKPYSNAIDLNNIINEKKINAILVGPGLKADQHTLDLITFLHDKKIPMLLDAGALTSLAKQPQIYSKILTSDIVITPHLGEFEKLFSTITNRDQDFKNIAAKYPNTTILLKGYLTLIGNGDKILTNDHTHPTLATAGSGDVLAGIIVALLAAGVNAYIACQIATWIHGQTAIDFGYGMIAEDIISGIPKAIQKLLLLS